MKAASKKDSPQAAELCGRLVKLSEKTFIEELSEVATSIDKEMEDYMEQIGLVVFADIIKTSFKKVGDKIKDGISNWADKLKRSAAKSVFWSNSLQIQTTVYSIPACCSAMSTS